MHYSCGKTERLGSACKLVLAIGSVIAPVQWPRVEATFEVVEKPDGAY